MDEAVVDVILVSEYFGKFVEACVINSVKPNFRRSVFCSTDAAELSSRVTNSKQSTRRNILFRKIWLVKFGAAPKAPYVFVVN